MHERVLELRVHLSQIRVRDLSAFHEWLELFFEKPLNHQPTGGRLQEIFFRGRRRACCEQMKVDQLRERRSRRLSLPLTLSGDLVRVDRVIADPRDFDPQASGGSDRHRGEVDGGRFARTAAPRIQQGETYAEPDLRV
ncbi:MAG TPA: hypothetical protein VGF45_03400 [Polyangia bacterium]